MNFKSTLWLNYLRPNLFVRDVSKINLTSLKANGVKLIICDLDNTLVPHFNKFPNKFVYDFINNVKYEGLKIVIASNNTKTRVEKFVNKLQETITIDGYLYSCKKPLVYKIKKYLKENNLSPSDTAIIGDQFLTDIFLANRLQSKSILVIPMVDPNKSTSYNLLQKILEKFIYKKLQLENTSIQEEKNESDFEYEEEYELL